MYGKPSFSDIDPAFSALWAVFLFLFGLILGLLPAGVVGAILASWLYKENKQVSMMVTFGRGLLIGGFSLVPVIILLFLTWPQAHGIPVYNNPAVFKVFFFRAITSVVIAALAGGRTGVQLAQQISGDQIIQS